MQHFVGNHTYSVRSLHTSLSEAWLSSWFLQGGVVSLGSDPNLDDHRAVLSHPSSAGQSETSNYCELRVSTGRALSVTTATCLPILSKHNTWGRYIEKYPYQLDFQFSQFAGFSYSNFAGLISHILGNNELYHTSLNNWLSAVVPSNSRWIRCFRAREHGWEGDIFHALCDGKGPTVTLVKAREFVFGGYLDKSWNGKSFKALRCYTRQCFLQLTAQR